MNQVLYNEAKAYALVALAPYLGQRFWHDNHMYMVDSVLPGHKLYIAHCGPKAGLPMNETITFSQHWDRLNRRIWHAWRGNELRTSKGRCFWDALSTEAA